MKIAYISEQDPFNIGLWSGTPFHIIKALKKQHDVVWIGGGIFNGVMWHQKFLENPHPRFVHDYSPEIGRVLSKELKDRNIDIVVSSGYQGEVESNYNYSWKEMIDIMGIRYR